MAAVMSICSFTEIIIQSALINVKIQRQTAVTAHLKSKQLLLIVFTLNFQPLEVVSRYRDSQPQVVEKHIRVSVLYLLVSLLGVMG